VDVEQLGRLGLRGIPARAPMAKAFGKVLGIIGRRVHKRQCVKPHGVNHEVIKSQHFVVYNYLFVVSIQKMFTLWSHPTVRIRHLKNIPLARMLRG
jgi:hypothetical protein